MNILGALLLSASTILCSLYLADVLKKRRNVLSECAALVRYISSEICYSDESINKIIKKASENDDFKFLKFLQDSALSDLSSAFDDVWCDCVDKHNKGLCFNSEINNLLKSFGSKLGKTDSAGQKELCSYYEMQFDKLLVCADAVLNERIKICHTVGLTSAVLMFIFVI